MLGFDKLISSLNEVERAKIRDYISAIRLPMEQWLNPGSTLITDEFSQEFRARIGFQHTFLKGPIFRETFDAAFINSARAGNRECIEASTGGRFWDVEIGGKRISLKSTAAKNISRDKLHISKLSEAAWIQDCRNAKMRQEQTIKYFEGYLEMVDSIVQLRYFEKERSYELVEFPCGLLAGILTAPREEFNADGPSIDIPIGQDPPDFTLKIDRSDAKITLSNIRKDVCLVHATWRLL